MAGDPPPTRRDVSDLAPFILTAELPPELHRWATGLRDLHFPPERNYLEAHVTLFHALPPQLEGELLTVLGKLAGENEPVPAKLEGIQNLGGGTALKLQSPPMLALRDRIADHFHGMLTAQDQHRPRLHVTIQNKVSSVAAKTLQADLAGMIEPREFAFTALRLFRYRGGPWEPVRRFAFRGSAKGR